MGPLYEGGFPVTFVAAMLWKRILEIEPSALHERCSVVLGSPEEVERVTSRLK